MSNANYSGIYFASAETEKAARFDMLVDLKSAKAHARTLRQQALAVGYSLELFGRALADPSARFEITANEITCIVPAVVPPAPKSFRVPRYYLGEAPINMIYDILETDKKIKSLVENTEGIDTEV
jgi:hypothetical protein